MADVNRLRIVRRLADGDATVTELIDHVGLSQPLVSLAPDPPARDRASSRPAGSGRETICRLRAEAFEEFAARQRAALGLVS